MTRIQQIDSLKGFLILLVVLGHILQGAIDENIVRYVIYSFHMPLFFCVSGYLFNYSKIKELSFSALIHKYLFRIIIPFVIALIVYNLILYLQDGYLAYIYYHLWFILSYLFCILVYWSFFKLNGSFKFMIVLSISIYIITKLISKFDLFENTYYDILNLSIRPYYILFFTLGVILRKRELKDSFLNKAILLLSIVGYLFLFSYPKSSFIPLCFLLLNISLAYFAISHLQNNYQNKFLTWVGINSMSMYLWHMLPVLLSKALANNDIEYYVLSFSFIVLFLYVLPKLNKVSFIRKYMFGLTN